MFDIATRKKLRFDSNVGDLSVEDLWDLNLTGGKASLEGVAKTINRLLKQEEEESFVTPKVNKVKDELTLKLDIVRHIINIKIKEKEEKEKAAENKIFNEKLDAIIAKKQDAALENMSAEDLQKLRR